MLNRIIFFTLFVISTLTAKASESELVRLSQNMLKTLRLDNNTDQLIKQYKNIVWENLITELNTKDKKLAFWINTYNAFVIQKLKTDSTQFEDKGGFYKNRDIIIAGKAMSFDDIEHGIIRNDRWKFSYGFFKDLFNPGWINDLKNTEIDGRVHFALNCGAEDCPPVAIYDDQDLSHQLDKITKSYLHQHTKEIGTKRVLTTPLMGWFRGDFGDISGIKRFLVQYEVIPETKDYKVVFGDYDWTLRIDNFIDL